MPRKAQVHVAGQVHLRQRGPNGIWHARYKTPTGRVEQSLKVTNLRVAQKKASEINELLDRDDFTTLTDRSRTKDITFATFWEEFKKNYTNWSPAMWQKNRACHNKLLAEFGPVPLRASNTRLIETYLARRPGSGRYRQRDRQPLSDCFEGRIQDGRPLGLSGA